MGVKNEKLCEFMDKAEIFADFVNGGICKGKQVVEPGELESVSKSYKENQKERQGRKTQTLRVRDVAKLLHNQRMIAIVAVENQDELNYMMPFRCLEYDVLDYARQIRRIAKQHKEAGNLKSGSEYLSKIKPEDRLIPVVTFVFYHGKGSWTACRQLHDMLNFEGENESFREFTANYQMNLITPADLDETKFKTGLRDVIGILKCQDDKDSLLKYRMKHKERLSKLDDDTYDVICAVLGQDDILEYKNGYRTAEGENDMCKAMEDWKLDLLAEGKAEGKAEGIKAFVLDNLEEKIPKQRILEKLQRRFSLNAEQAEKYYDDFTACEEKSEENER